MSDPVTPAAPDATAPAPSAPAPTAAPAQTAAPVAPRPPRVNPWALRPAKPTPAPGDAPSQSAPVNAAPASQPVTDPRVDALMAVLGETVTQDLAALAPNVQGAVKAIAGDDPVALRKAINAMRANGIATAPVAPAPAPLPMPTTTTAAPAAPAAAPAEPTGDAAVLAQYQHMKSKGAHIAAASFYAQNAGSIERALKSSASN